LNFGQALILLFSGQIGAAARQINVRIAAADSGDGRWAFRVSSSVIMAILVPVDLLHGRRRMYLLKIFRNPGEIVRPGCRNCIVAILKLARGLYRTQFEIDFHLAGYGVHSKTSIAPLLVSP